MHAAALVTICLAIATTSTHAAVPHYNDVDLYGSPTPDPSDRIDAAAVPFQAQEFRREVDMAESTVIRSRRVSQNLDEREEGNTWVSGAAVVGGLGLLVAAVVVRRAKIANVKGETRGLAA